MTLFNVSLIADTVCLLSHSFTQHWQTTQRRNQTYLHLHERYDRCCMHMALAPLSSSAFVVFSVVSPAVSCLSQQEIEQRHAETEKQPRRPLRSLSHCSRLRPPWPSTDREPMSSPATAPHTASGQSRHSDTRRRGRRAMECRTGGARGVAADPLVRFHVSAVCCAGVSPPAVSSSLPCAVSLRVIRVFRPDGSHVNFSWNTRVCNIRRHIGVKGAWGVQQRGGATTQYMNGEQRPPAGEYDIVIGHKQAHTDTLAPQARATTSATAQRSRLAIESERVCHPSFAAALFVLLRLAVTVESSLDQLWSSVSSAVQSLLPEVATAASAASASVSVSTAAATAVPASPPAAATAAAAAPAAPVSAAPATAVAASPSSSASAAAALPLDPPLPLVRVFRPNGSYEPFAPDICIRDVSAAIQLDGVCAPGRSTDERRRRPQQMDHRSRPSTGGG